ncbi:hypothetical protein, partial [Acinetobacter baumannii]
GTWVRAQPAAGEKLHNAQRELLETFK